VVVKVPNEKNLKRLSPSEARENGRKGGKASANARRQRKTLRENMNLLLNLEVSSVKDFDELSKMGIPLEDIDNSMLLTAALFQKAKTGDVAAYKEIRDLIGESAPAENGDLLDLIAGMKNDRV
jgi:hypothetical protein